MAGEYFEGFDSPGKPVARNGIHWGYTDELTPIKGWKEMIPGDGFAHISVRASSVRKSASGGNPLPFQTLSLGPVGPGHRISMKAKNTAIPGVACTLFTYLEKSGVNEIDIEIVPRDTQSGDKGHPIGINGGWTDIRLNTWADAREDRLGSLRPMRSLRQAIRDDDGKKVSHSDGRYHIYTIEWLPRSVTFLVDGVIQGVIENIVPLTPSTIIVGMRRMPWAGTAEWTGTQTMVIDWIDIERIDGEAVPDTERGESKQIH